MSVQYQSLIQKAHDAGMIAGSAINPRAMIVSGPGERYFVPGGCCGFASAHIEKGQIKFSNFLKRQKIGYKAYQGGYNVPCHEFGQSLERKEAYCNAYVKVLSEAGIKCYVESRMD